MPQTARRARTPQRTALAVAAAAYVFVPLCWCWLRLVGPLPGERAIAVSPYHPPRPVGQALAFVGGLGDPVVAFLIVALATSIVRRHVGPRAAILVVAAAGVVLASAALKSLLGPTPLWLATHGDSPNYPSGHVAFVTAVFGLLGWITFRRRAFDVAAMCGLAVLAIGPSRVASKTHLLSDVLAGYALGVGWLISLFLLSNLERLHEEVNGER